MFDHSKNKTPILPKSQNITLQSVALGVGFLLMLQTILLVVLIFQQTGRSVEANRTPPDCIRLFGFNPNNPQSDSADCRPAPISIAQKV
jgi:hypothetical protein